MGLKIPSCKSLLAMGTTAATPRVVRPWSYTSQWHPQVCKHNKYIGYKDDKFSKWKQKIFQSTIHIIKLFYLLKKRKNSNLLAKFIFWKSFFLSEKQKLFFFFKFIYQSDQLNKNTPTVSPGEDRRLDQTKHYK